MTLDKPTPRQPERIRLRQVRFLGEQSGPPERLLKERLADFLRHDKTVNRAYLARVEFGDGKNVSVVLGLQTLLEPGKQLLATVASTFASVFNAKEHLDIMFLTDEQERQLKQVCKPFFEQERC